MVFSPSRYLVMAFTAQTRVMGMVEDDEMAEVAVPGYVDYPGYTEFLVLQIGNGQLQHRPNGSFSSAPLQPRSIIRTRTRINTCLFVHTLYSLGGWVRFVPDIATLFCGTVSVGAGGIIFFVQATGAFPPPSLRSKHANPNSECPASHPWVRVRLYFYSP